MIVELLDIIIAGLLLGGIYALIAVGLSLQYGVARVFNISHGEFIMLGAFATWILYATANINPLISLIICGPFVFLIGFFLHKTLFRSLLSSSPSMDIFESKSMLACFGLLFIIQNLAMLIWGTDFKGYSYLNVGVNIGGAVFAANRLVTLLYAVVIGTAFYLFLAFTRLGKAIRAAAQDPRTAGLMGVDINQVLALCFGFGAVMAGFAGALISMCYPIQTTMGLEYTVIAIIVVTLGGLGSIVGSFVGGFLLGLIGSIVSYIEPSLYMVVFYFIFSLLLLVRPKGILGK
ncbi:MAG: branched-chain amino acid ABC transporter permease [Deltaproteobacteria bacterium]|nr:MAG: branched-chain amino acid ABC transporter permease [Deltaproteobacteria bacterium]